MNVINDEQLSRKMPGVAATVNGRPIGLEVVAEECIQRYGEEVLEGEMCGMSFTSKARVDIQEGDHIEVFTRELKIRSL